MSNGLTTVSDKVHVGATTIGLVVAAIPGAVDLVLKAVQEGKGITVSGPDKYLALITLGSGAIVGLGRYAQAVAKTIVGRR